MRRAIFATALVLAAPCWGLRAQHAEPGTRNPDAMVRVGFAKPGGGYIVETVPLESYVARVVAGEAARDSRPAALEALAITVRTFALANRGRHRADGFDLCDQTHCQVVRAATAATERAANATAGLALLRGGAPASIYYTASCGGRTEIPSAVWPGAEDPPFLPSHDDDACGGAPAWTADLAAADLLRAFRQAGFAGSRLRDLRIVTRDVSGRVARLRLEGLTPDLITGQDLRVAVGRTLGWQHIKSTAFDLRSTGDRYRFSGHGSGHGVGLCVIGSARLAEAGQSAPAILGRYFPGLAIGAPGAKVTLAAAAVVPPGVVLALPDGDDGERDHLGRLVASARDELASALGVPPPARVTVRVHPTIASYARATGQPWFTAGAMVNGELQLPPLAVLRDRGVLDTTIRRELVHAMADDALASRPAWVRAGAAMYFAGLRTAAPREGTAPAACPSEPELLRPTSAGALSNADARALACFTRQVESGRRWTDVR